MNMDSLSEMHYAAHDPQFEPEPDLDWMEYREQLEAIQYEIEEARDSLRVLNAEYHIEMKKCMRHIDDALDLIERQMENL